MKLRERWESFFVSKCEEKKKKRTGDKYIETKKKMSPLK
jgi:hypothetical protein